MTVFETEEDMIVVDAGLMFPEETMLGVDYVIPDYTYILERRDKLRAIVVTHGHEDHTGALPFIMRDLGSSVPIIGTGLTIGLIKEKIREFNLKHLTYKIVKPRDTVSLGCFKVEFIHVTHSIADGVGLGISTPLGYVVHTGDFKLDFTPVDGELLDYSKFSEYGEKGTLLLLSDSTNAEKAGITPSEKEVKRAFEYNFAKAKGRIIIATFASNIHRIQQAIDVAVELGKKVVLCGRSVISNARIAADLGYLRFPGNKWYKVEQINSMEPDEVVIITTGSQGEPMSVLTRISMNEHKHIKVASGDTVIISARAIPGNERAVGKIINHLFKRGANVVYDKISDVHVSGHASKDELRLMLNLIKPKYFIPVHGEYRQLVYHAKLASDQNIPNENIFVMQDGEVLEITPERASKRGTVPAGRVYIDGKGFVDRDNVILKDRKRLAQDGFVIVLISVSKDGGQLLSEPEIISKGFSFENSHRDIISEAKKIIRTTFENLDRDIIKDTSAMQAKVQSTLKKYIRSNTQKSPLIMPIIVEV